MTQAAKERGLEKGGVAVPRFQEKKRLFWGFFASMKRGDFPVQKRRENISISAKRTKSRCLSKGLNPPGKTKKESSGKCQGVSQRKEGQKNRCLAGRKDAGKRTCSRLVRVGGGEVFDGKMSVGKG